MAVLHLGNTRDSSLLNLAVCIGGIYICYLSYGIFQEKMCVFHTASGALCIDRLISRI